VSKSPREIRAVWWTNLDRQTGSTLRSTPSQNLSAVLCAHAFTESMFAFFLEIRWLLIRKRHTIHSFTKKIRERAHYRDEGIPCQTGISRPIEVTTTDSEYRSNQRRIVEAHQLIDNFFAIEALLWIFLKKRTRLPQVYALYTADIVVSPYNDSAVDMRPGLFFMASSLRGLIL
jgi:hypothetical protein